MSIHDFDKVIRATLLENSEPWPMDVSEIPNYLTRIPQMDC